MHSDHYPLVWLSIDLLKPHEAIKEKKAAHYTRFAARNRKMLAKPILVDRESRVILDGHHRYSVCKELGVTEVPCILVDYLQDDSIRVEPRRKDIPVSKEHVIEMGLSGNVYPPKTTKHTYDIPAMEKMVDFKHAIKKGPGLG